MSEINESQDYVHVSRIEDVLLQAGDFLSCGGSDAKAILKWIGDELLPNYQEEK